MTMRINRLARAAAIGIGTLAAGNAWASAIPLLALPQISPNQIVAVNHIPTSHAGNRLDW